MNDLIKALQKGFVEISFKSIVSSRIITRVYTLKGVNLPQNQISDKIVLLEVDTNTYEDIVKETIVEWKQHK